MTSTLEAVGDRHGQPTAAVVTSDGATWSWPDLIDQFGPAIRSFARSRGASSPDDVVQDVFATAVERFPTFSGDSSGLRSFLFTLAYRRVADDHRARYRRQEYLVADHEPNAEVTVGLEDSITELETASEAMKALDVLGERERRVIEMRIIEEASPAEVADALGLSNGNVRVIQARALLKVRKYLETRSGALPSFGLAFAFLGGLRSNLPSRGGLAEWVEILQAESTRETAKAAAAGAGSVIAAGSASTAPVGAIAGSVLKIGLVVALATVTAVDVETDDDPGEQVAPRAEAVAAVVPVESGTEPADTGEPSTDAEAPTPSSGVSPVATQTTDSVTHTDPETRQPTTIGHDDPAGPGIQPKDGFDPDADGTESPVGGVAEPVVGGVVDGAVDDAGSTVEKVVGGVVGTVDTVVDDMVQPVVDVVEESVDTVGNTVDVTVGNVVEVVDDTTDIATDTVDTIGGITNGLGS